MLEFFRNDYIIEILRKKETVQYNFISTHPGWKKAVNEVASGLRDRECDHRNLPQSSRSQSGLFSEYATISRGKTSRVTFAIHSSEKHKSAQENPSVWERIKFCVFALYMAALIMWILFCAFTGLVFVICSILSVLWH